MALRQHLPQLELSALYLPMRALARRRETSHPYLGLSGKALQAAWTRTGDDLLDGLATCCEHRAVDQEAVNVKDHVQLAALSLAEALRTQEAGRP